MSAENYLHRDPLTGLRVLAGDYLDEILPHPVSFQLALRKHAEESQQSDDDEDDDIVDLEIFFCDPNCGLLASDRKPSRVVVLSARYLAVYTHAGVLKHKIALESIKRVEFMTTSDDVSGAVLVVLKDPLAAPIIFSILTVANAKNRTASSNSTVDPSRDSSADSRQSPSGASPNNNNNNTGSGEDELNNSPTSRIADLRFAIGALCRICAEQDQVEKVREQALKMQQQTESDNAELLLHNQQDIIANTATSVNTIVVINTENAVKLDLLLRSLAGQTIDAENSSTSASSTQDGDVGIPPLEIPRATRPPPGSTAPVVETLERLSRKEKELAFEDAKEALVEANQRKANNKGFKTSAQRQGIEALIDGLNLWIGSRSNLVTAKNAHANTQSNLETMMAALRQQHEARNEQLLRLADDAQRLANEHNESVGLARREVEQIDARIKLMENELQAATDSYTEAMRHKDVELLEAKQIVDRMRHDLTKGAYSELPSLADLQSECERLENNVALQSARAEQLHISAPDKSVMKHLTNQLEEENNNLQEEILSVKKQRRTLTQQLISHRMDLANAEARGEAARKKSTDFRRRKVRADADNGRLKDAINTLERRVENLHAKLRRVKLEAVVVEDLKREELMHKSMIQSVRHDIRADWLERRRVERMMKEEQERRSKSRELAYREAMGYQ